VSRSGQNEQNLSCTHLLPFQGPSFRSLVRRPLAASIDLTPALAGSDPCSAAAPPLTAARARGLRVRYILAWKRHRPEMAPSATLLAAALLLFADPSGAQQTNPAVGCGSEAELLASLSWVHDACTEEGEQFDEDDALVPTVVTTRGCAQVVRRVATNCDGLLARSPVWFGSRRAALAAAVASAVALEVTDGPPGSGQNPLLLADPSLTTIRACGATLEDGLELFEMPGVGYKTVAIDVGPSRGHLRLDFEQLSVDKADALHLYADADQNTELGVIRNGDLPLEGPIELPGKSAVYLQLVSDRRHPPSDRRTSLRATVRCVGPCAELPCQNGGTCTEVDAAAVTGQSGHRRQLQVGGAGHGTPCTISDVSARSSAVNAVCCDEVSEDCSNGQPTTCNSGCAAVLVPYLEDCRPILQASDDGDALVDQLQNTLALCAGPSSASYQCSCAPGFSGTNCEHGLHFPGSQLLTPEWDVLLASWSAGSVSTYKWSLCCSTFQGCDTGLKFHEACDAYTNTLTVARNSARNHTFGGFVRRVALGLPAPSSQ
jgi:hypothetical protein